MKIFLISLKVFFFAKNDVLFVFFNRVDFEDDLAVFKVDFEDDSAVFRVDFEDDPAVFGVKFDDDLAVFEAFKERDGARDRSRGAVDKKMLTRKQIMLCNSKV